MIKRGFLRSTTHEPHQMAQAVPSAWCVPLSGVHPFDGHLCDTWWPPPPLWWPPCWRLLMLLHHLLLFSCLLVTSNFALSLSQIINNFLWRQGNAKGLFGCRMQNIPHGAETGKDATLFDYVRDSSVRVDCLVAWLYLVWLCIGWL